MGQAAAAAGPASRPRSAGAEHRRVPAGQPVDPEGAGLAGGDRPAVSASAGPPGARRAPAGGGGRCGGSSPAHIVGTLARYTGDFALAEDLAQEALAEALVSLAARRRAREPGGLAAHRRPAARDRRLPPARAPATSGTPRSRGSGPRTGPSRTCCGTRTGSRTTPSALMFVALPPGAVPGVAGRAHAPGRGRPDQRRDRPRVPGADRRPCRPASPGQEDARRRAGAVRGAAGRPERRERLGSVLSVLYVIFTEGSTATSGRRPDPPRPGGGGDPAGPGAGPAGSRRAGGPRPARPAGADRRPLPRPARRRRRAGAAGGPGPPPVGPRPRSGRGRAALDQAGRVGRGLGAYGVQAAIAACHAAAPSVAATDWERVVLLYEVLGRLAPSPVVELNRAVALAMAEDRPPRWRWWTNWSRPAASPAPTCCRASAGSLLARLGRADDARAEPGGGRRPLRQRAGAGPAAAQDRPACSADCRSRLSREASLPMGRPCLLPSRPRSPPGPAASPPVGRPRW